MIESYGIEISPEERERQEEHTRRMATLEAGNRTFLQGYADEITALLAAISHTTLSVEIKNIGNPGKAKPQIFVSGTAIDQPRTPREVQKILRGMLQTLRVVSRG